MPLRHQRNESAVGRQVREVGDGDAFAANLTGEMIDFFVRHLEKLVEQAEFVHQLER